jgi:hypothetical protein
VDDLKQDTVVAGEYELQVSDKKKKKAGESDDPQGKVDVRVYYSLLMVRLFVRVCVRVRLVCAVVCVCVVCVVSCACDERRRGLMLHASQETRPPGPGPHTYNYADYLGQIKTGDLVVYSGTGALIARLRLAAALAQQ